jgi:hypothetical protein
MKKLIKNYSTEVPLEKTLAEIQSLLANNGATGIMFDYDGQGNLNAVFFKIRYGEKDLPFRLPAKPQQVYNALFAGMQYENRLREDRMKKAQRIAWRICKLWLEAQITHINLDQATPQEVFLPYLVMPNNKTLYEVMEEHKFLLPSGKEDKQS